MMLGTFRLYYNKSLFLNHRWLLWLFIWFWFGFMRFVVCRFSDGFGRFRCEFMFNFMLNFWLNFQSIKHVCLGHWRLEFRYVDNLCLMNSRLSNGSFICRSLVDRHWVLGCLIYGLLNFRSWLVFWQFVHWFRITMLILQIVIKETKVESSIFPRCFRKR